MSGSENMSVCTDVALVDVLARIGGQLSAVADDLAQTHPLASSLDWAVASKDLHFIQAVQKLDELEQTVRGLERFLSIIGSDVPGDLRVDLHKALASVMLSALADRLSGKDHLPADDTSGDCDFL